VRALPGPVVPHAFRVAIARLLGDARDLDRRHYDVMRQIATARTGATFELPRGLRVTVEPDHIIVSIGPMPSLAIPPGTQHPIPWAGEIGAWHIEIRRSSGDAPPATGAIVRLPPDAVLRARRPGDVVLTRAGHKKLKDAYIDRKVPRRHRDSAPVIAAGSHVLWTPHTEDLPACAGDPFVVTQSDPQFPS
jgi:tRNA(Ile)-lysidine synthetase-like protein